MNYHINEIFLRCKTVYHLRARSVDSSFLISYLVNLKHRLYSFRFYVCNLKKNQIKQFTNLKSHFANKKKSKVQYVYCTYTVDIFIKFDFISSMSLHHFCSVFERELFCTPATTYVNLDLKSIVYSYYF